MTTAGKARHFYRRPYSRPELFSMDNQSPDPAVVGVWNWLAGLAGALVSLAHLQTLNRWQKVGTVGAGMLTAGFCGPWVAEQLGVSRAGGAAVHFLLGLGGLILTAGLVSLFRSMKDNPAAALGEILKRIGGKGG